jgi:hypothetical protein
MVDSHGGAGELGLTGLLERIYQRLVGALMIETDLLPRRIATQELI